MYTIKFMDYSQLNEPNPTYESNSPKVTSIDVDNIKFMGDEFYSNYPRRATIQMYADAWILDNFLYSNDEEISYENEEGDIIIQALSNILVRVYNDGLLMLTGIVDKTQTKFDYKYVTITAIDFVWLYSKIGNQLNKVADEMYKKISKLYAYER